MRTRRKQGAIPLIEYDEMPCPVAGLIGPCHIYRGGKHERGYGLMKLHRRTVRVHRYVWERDVGPIPPGLLVDHQCRNTGCCNVNHLRVVTPKVNSTENVVGIGWQLQAAKTHCAQGHEYSEANTHHYKNKRRCRACGRAFAKRKYHVNKSAGVPR